MVSLYFGVTVQSVIDALPQGTDACDLGGPTLIEMLIAKYWRKLLGELSPVTFETICRPDRQQIVKYTTSTTTSATVGLFPILAGSQVRLITYPDTYDSDYQINQVEGVTVNYTTGLLSFPAVPQNSQLWVSYEVDLDAVLIPSLADIIRNGVVGDLLLQNIPEGQFGFKYGEAYMESWNDEIKRLRDNDKGIPELRKLTFWNDINDMPTVISMRKMRDA